MSLTRVQTLISADRACIGQLPAHDSTPETLMPEGNKSRVSGDGLESNRQATNSPGIQVDSNRFDCLDEKVGLGVEP